VTSTAGPAGVDGVLIETPRLRLRPLREGDAEVLARIFSDPDVVRYSGGRSPSLEEVAEGIQSHISAYYRDRAFGLLAVELRETGEVVGRVGFLTTELDDRADAELHYHLSPSAWGDGLATEATRAVLGWASGERGLVRIVAAIHPENAASIRVAEKCGLRFWKEATLSGPESFLIYAFDAPSG
jgi:RimJ/RimL family protein N-acetyltransferase